MINTNVFFNFTDFQDDNDVATKFVPNNLTRTKRMTELDLALMNHHMVSIDD